jgi:hypothetical protein
LPNSITRPFASSIRAIAESEEPNVLGVGQTPLRRRQRGLDLAAELGEQVGDDLLLRVIVLAQIAGAMPISKAIDVVATSARRTG